MNPAKILLGMFAFSLLASAAQDARADLRICNRRSSKMWVAHSTFVPSTSVVRRPCGTIRASNGCAFSAWETAGWKTAEPNQCVTAVIGSFGSRNVYIRAMFADGGLVSGPFPVTVQFQAGFKWMEDQTLPSGCAQAIIPTEPCNAQPVDVGFKEFTVANSTNATLDIF